LTPFGLAFMLGPAIGAALFAWNGDAFWLFCGLLGVLSGLLLLAGRPRSVVQTAVAQPDHPGGA
jgi:hypothetical protein